MNEKLTVRTSLYFTGIVAVAIWTLLAWNYFHGGIPSHHLLARKDMPEISNAWGALLLPLLTWFLLYRIRRRRMHDQHPMHVFPGFTGALLFGILLSLFFNLGYADVPVYMFYGLFLLALFVPVYRAECLLGFVIGMTYTFGAVLPTGVGSVLILICAVLFLYVRGGILYIKSRLGGQGRS
jgi:hypothetical protein